VVNISLLSKQLSSLVYSFEELSSQITDFRFFLFEECHFPTTSTNPESVPFNEEEANSDGMISLILKSQKIQL
jgi:hypothetical protein